MTVFFKIQKRTHVYELYRLWIESESRAIRAISTSPVRESVWIVLNKLCGAFIKPSDF